MPTKKNVYFYIYISYFFTGLILIFALIMGAVQFPHMSRIILTQANNAYELIGKEITTDVREIYEPVKNQTEILAQIHPLPGNSLVARLRNVDYMAKAIEKLPSATSTYVGYANGDFFSVASVCKIEWRQRSI